jgi:hypothetical protein
MAKKAPVFGRIDGWIFASLGSPERGLDDTEIYALITVADVLNHAIPELDELRRSLRLLYEHGLVEFGDIGVRRTLHGHMVARNCDVRRGGLFSIVENMTKALNSTAIKHPSVEGTPDLSYFTKRRYDAALKKWQRFVNEATNPQPETQEQSKAL